MAAGLGKLRCSVADKVAGYFAGAGVEAAGVLVGVSIGVVVRFRFGVWLAHVLYSGCWLVLDIQTGCDYSRTSRSRMLKSYEGPLLIERKHFIGATVVGLLRS
ncbi:hypothetical protein Droror1_Dr00023242 [Drosera rotundifolia]